eukprot:3404326-Alexandrium_andersonii.AAC.2
MGSRDILRYREGLDEECTMDKFEGMLGECRDPGSQAWKDKGEELNQDSCRSGSHRRGIAEVEGNSGRRRFRGIQEGAPVVCQANTHGTSGTQAESDEAHAGKDRDG